MLISADDAIQFMFQKPSKSFLKTLLVLRNPVLLSELLVLGFGKKSSKRIIMDCLQCVPRVQVETCSAWTLKQSFSCCFCLTSFFFIISKLCYLKPRGHAS